ncbi:non-specific lipid-transfer protein C4-like [Phragmites australis]|uniref:non-specific lipid-transfer protein C4-like n=1 Tax=Phragmites australis TaxID=29695 RepID=UPI002D779692|nr:non-specific lipid-transfer protein C4-like [Phragmites australis]
MASDAAKPSALVAACLVLLVLGGGYGPTLRGAEAQGGGECVPQLNRLLACRAYLVPGAPDPSPDCCSALSGVSHDCACSTMGIINSLPSRCNLGQVNCSA